MGTRRRLLTATAVAAAAAATGIVLLPRPADSVAVVLPDRPAAHPAAAPPATVTVVALGDSVPAGTACDCTPFVDLYAQQLAASQQVPVRVVNLAVPGQTSDQLLASLSDDDAVTSAVASADVVTVTIGANDFGAAPADPAGCPQLSCYDDALASADRNVAAALQRIRALHGPRPASVRLTGYWAVWKDGSVARALGSDYMEVDDAVTRRLNAGLAATARAAGAGYVDLYSAFRGSDGTHDDDDLLAADGDHPSARGHQVIAEALSRSGLDHPVG